MVTKNSWWIKPVLIVSGIFWIARAVLEFAFNPNYYDPRSVTDYLAVIGTSLELLTLALGMWGFAITQDSHTQGKIVWRFGIILICTSAILAGTANLFEDVFDLNAIGFLFPIGIVALSVGLLISGLSALRISQMSRGIGWLILLCLAGLFNVEDGGGIAAGLSLIALADLSSGAQ